MMKHNIAAGILALTLGACATPPVPTTPAQSWYATKAAYATALTAAADYCERPEREQERCARWATQSLEAEALVAAGDDALANGASVADYIAALRIVIAALEVSP